MEQPDMDIRRNDGGMTRWKQFFLIVFNFLIHKADTVFQVCIERIGGSSSGWGP